VSLRSHFGLAPRRPERLMVLAGGLLLTFLLAMLMAALAFAGEFGRHAPRLFFYLWILGLIVAACALARWPGWAAVPLCLAAVDLGLGCGLADAGANPLLQAVPTPSFRGGAPGLSVAHSMAGTRGRERSAAELEQRVVIAAFWWQHHVRYRRQRRRNLAGPPRDGTRRRPFRRDQPWRARLFLGRARRADSLL